MDFKALMFNHGEKIALGVSGLLFIGYILVGFVLSGKDSALEAVEGSRSEVANLLSSNPPVKQVMPEYVKLVKAPWEQVAAPVPGKDGVVYYQTEMIPVIMQGATATPVVIEKVRTHKSPTIDKPSAEIGKVMVKWTRSPETTATIASYQVYRKKGGEKDFSLVHELTGGSQPKEGEEGPAGAVRGSDFSYEDTSVEAKQEYSYKVKSITKDKDPKKVDHVERESGVVSVRTVSDIDMVLKGGQESLATILVRKYMSGKWEEKTFYVKPNDMIGEAIKKYVGQNQVTVDFSTNYKLLEIRKEKKEFKRTERVRVKDEEGNLVWKEEERVDKRDQLKIVYLDDEGKKNELWQAE